MSQIEPGTYDIHLRITRRTRTWMVERLVPNGFGGEYCGGQAVPLLSLVGGALACAIPGYDDEADLETLFEAWKAQERQGQEEAAVLSRAEGIRVLMAANGCNHERFTDEQLLEHWDAFFEQNGG